MTSTFKSNWKGVLCSLVSVATVSLFLLLSYYLDLLIPYIEVQKCSISVLTVVK